MGLMVHMLPLEENGAIKKYLKKHINAASIFQQFLLCMDKIEISVKQIMFLKQLVDVCVLKTSELCQLRFFGNSCKAYA